MALAVKSNNLGKLLVPGLVLVALAVGGYFLWQFISSRNENGTQDLPAATNRKVITEYNSDFLQDPAFLQLRDFSRDVNMNLVNRAGNPEPFKDKP